MSSQPVDNQLLQKSLWLLSQRDHGSEELKEKIRLSVKRSALRYSKPITPIDEEALQQVILWCQSQGLLDDLCFSERYIQGRSRRGYGVQRIRQELQQKGIDTETISQALAQCDIDWYQTAYQAAEKKFTDLQPAEYKQKVKIQRYLYSRGFSSDEIRQVFTIFPS